MGYVTVSQVQADLPRHEISDATNPNILQVQNWIDSISAEIDALCASQGYLIPISGASSLALLRSICLNGAGYYALRVMFPHVTQGHVMEKREDYQQQMSDLRLGMLILPDAPKNSANEPATFSTLNPDCVDSVRPFITRGMQF